jgi:hypothetical protein
MYCGSGNVTALAYMIRLCYAAHAQCHLAVQDDVRRRSVVSVFRIESAGPILPHVDTRKTLPTQLLFEFFFLELRNIISSLSIAIEVEAGCPEKSERTEGRRKLAGGAWWGIRPQVQRVLRGG